MKKGNEANLENRLEISSYFFITEYQRILLNSWSIGTKDLYQIGSADVIWSRKIAKSYERKIPESTSKKSIKPMQELVEDDFIFEAEWISFNSEDDEVDRDSPESSCNDRSRDLVTDTKANFNLPPKALGLAFPNLLY